MICIICHGQDIQAQEVEEPVKIGSDIIYVPVQLLVCQTCGERYYDRATLRYLEEVEKELREGSARTHETGRVLKYG
jgi:YgiT-type zinc finger domain-containing protein